MAILSRRYATWFLILAAALFLAACVPDRRSSSPTVAPAGAALSATVPSAPSATTQAQAEPTKPVRAELDLREANVLEVQYEFLGDRRYRFDVTLLHDDDGEAPSYADKWQVWDTQGNLLGERVLTHSHGTQPFTRSATIEIPDGVFTVLVRGHDMEHGHGGQSMRVDLESGEMEVYEEGG